MAATIIDTGRYHNGVYEMTASNNQTESTPFETAFKVALVILGGEFAIMLAIDFLFKPSNIIAPYFWHLVDPVLLTLIVAPALHFLVLRPMKAQQQKLELQKAELTVAAVTFDAQQGVVVTDERHTILRVNRSFTRVTGYESVDVVGKTPAILSSGLQNHDFYLEMRQALREDKYWQGEIWNRRKNGEIYPEWLTITSVRGENGQVFNVGIFSDITDRKQAEEEIHRLAFYDALTGLPNRRLLLDRMNKALIASVRSQSYGAVLFLDMDRFKTLNDTLGHDYGDLLLIEVASRIQDCLREADTIARFGGDEFVILLEEVDAHAEEACRKIAVIAEKIRHALSSSYYLRSHVHHSSPSIGVSLFLGNQESVDDLLKYADVAMYQAKEAGRNAVRFFDPVMQQAVAERVGLEADLRHARLDEQLHLHYQIQVDSEGGATGAEALIRWVHPRLGMISPAQFIPIAEESLLMLLIGNWVLTTACRQLASWAQQEPTRHLTMAVNVSALQFKQPDFVDRVAAVLQNHAVDATRLKLELTESVILSNLGEVVKKMHALKALGVRLSMDDFGTGYSSLSYLKQLPLDQIKIDQSFVRGMALDVNDATMVQTIIDMAHNFNLDVIAEGVETADQFNLLKQFGCLAYQGYYFGRPVPVDNLLPV